MSAKRPGRRAFLKHGGALAGLAVGADAAVFGSQATPAQTPPALQRRRAYGERSAFETVARQTTTPEGHTPLHAQMGIITPSSLHYVVSHGYDPPAIDPRTHQFLLHGLVERALIFTVDDLKRLTTVCRSLFIESPGNRWHRACKQRPIP